MYVFTTYQSGGKGGFTQGLGGKLWIAVLKQKERIRMLLFLDDSTLL